MSNMYHQSEPSTYTIGEKLVHKAEHTHDKKAMVDHH